MLVFLDFFNLCHTGNSTLIQQGIIKSMPHREQYFNTTRSHKICVNIYIYIYIYIERERERERERQRERERERERMAVQCMTTVTILL